MGNGDFVVERIELLDLKIREAGQTIRQLREKHVKLADQCRKQQKEMELLHSENQQVRKLMVELDRTREDRKQIRQKCERLLSKFHKMSL